MLWGDINHCTTVPPSFLKLVEIWQVLFYNIQRANVLENLRATFKFLMKNISPNTSQWKNDLLAMSCEFWNKSIWTTLRISTVSSRLFILWGKSWEKQKAFAFNSTCKTTWPLLTYLVSRPNDFENDEFFGWKWRRITETEWHKLDVREKERIIKRLIHL